MSTVASRRRCSVFQLSTTQEEHTFKVLADITVRDLSVEVFQEHCAALDVLLAVLDSIFVFFTYPTIGFIFPHLGSESFDRSEKFNLLVTVSLSSLNQALKIFSGPARGHRQVVHHQSFVMEWKATGPFTPLWYSAIT